MATYFRGQLPERLNCLMGETPMPFKGRLTLKVFEL